METRRGSILIIALITVTFLGALAVAVMNPVTASREITDVMYSRKMAQLVAESAAERVKAIMCQDTGPTWEDGTSQCVKDAISNNEWDPTLPSENGDVDEALITFPTVDSVGSGNLPRFDTSVTDANYPHFPSPAGNDIRYLVYTSTETDEYGHAQSYVSAMCNGQVVNMKVTYRKGPEDHTREIPNPWIQPNVKAAFGKDGLTMGGNKFTDSYDSRIGDYGDTGNVNENGDVGSDSTLDASGGMVNGDAYVLDEDDFTGSESNISKEVIVHDDPTQMPDIIYPDSDPNWNPTTYTTLAAPGTPTYGPGDIHVTGDLTLSGNATGKIKIQAPARIIIDGDFQSTGHGLIEVLPGNKVDENGDPVLDENGDPVPGDVKIFHKGSDVLISGNGVDNTGVPTNFRFFTGAPNVKISGTSEFRGVIYAPDAHIKATGNADFKGALIASTIEIKGSPHHGIHFDEALLYADFDDDIEKIKTETETKYTGPYEPRSFQILD